MQNGDGGELPSRPPSPPRGTRPLGARASTARRSGTGSTIGRWSPSVEEPPPPQDDIAAQHAELQRQQREIEAIQKELAGENPGVDVEIEGVVSAYVCQESWLPWRLISVGFGDEAWGEGRQLSRTTYI